MRLYLRSLIDRVPALKRLLPHRKAQGRQGIRQLGHRDYVGGLWEEMGRLQLEFLKRQGLRPDHCLLDIACGSLRAGVLLVPYLEAGNYLGIDKEQDLIDAGIEHELGRALYEQRQPQLVVSSAFEFERFTRKADFAIAQSLFTHLPPSVIDLCFRKLPVAMKPTGVFFATFFEVARPMTNPDEPHDHGVFHYTRGQMHDFGVRHGWRPHYIGDWGHPRGQMMMKYTWESGSDHS